MKATVMRCCLMAAISLTTSRNTLADIVTLDDNGGYGGMGSVEATYGMSMPWIWTPWYDNEHRFEGYYDCDGKMYYDKDGNGVAVWDKNEDSVLYAHWEDVTYLEVAGYDLGNGWDFLGFFAIGEELPPVFIEQHDGWICKGGFGADDTPYYDQEGNPIRVWDGGCDCIYFYWEPKKYKATLTHDKESGIPDREIEIYFACIVFDSVEVPVWYGHRFLGYFGENGVMYIQEQGYGANDWDIAEDATLYARWELEEVQVKYENGYDGGAFEFKTGKYSQSFPSVEPPSRRGYTLIGFCDEVGNMCVDANGRSLRNIDTVEPITLRAMWRSKTEMSQIEDQLMSAVVGSHVEIVLQGEVLNTGRELMIPSGVDAVLDLNGFVLDRGLSGESAVVSGRVIRVEGSLTIKDSFGGGRITGGNVTGDGGGILVAKNGVLRLLGGTVCGNTATGAGGGVYGEKHSAVFLGAGKIQGNKARNGCGIEIPYGTFRLCDDTSHEAEECNLHPYSPGLILMFK